MQQQHFTFSRLMHRTSILWRAHLDVRLRAWDINMTAWQILLWLVQQEEVRYNQYTLASRLGIETSHLVRLLDRMERRDLLKREADLQDRRQNHVIITPKGSALLDEVEAEIVRLHETILADISEDSQENAIRLLEQIVKNITKMTGEQASGTRRQTPNEPPETGR
ncbi:MAG: MarR family transcriptional regulator [Zoogloeaceae bacterium]|jgi:DNA-binding MarR family transcriptional regulator|nr:MarR family transcriptional regulator [Zoogloeaceae bacterium]